MRKITSIVCLLAVLLVAVGLTGCPPAKYTLTMAVTGSGTTLPQVGATQYSDGTVVTVTATPATGWVFDHWSGDLSGSANPVTIAMDGDKTVTAVFVQDAVTRTLTMAVAGGDGTVDPQPGEHTYSDGMSVTVTATAFGGWHFDHWEGDLAGTTNPATIVMNADKTVTAVLAQNAVTRTLTMAVTGNGSVTPGVGANLFNDGETVTLSAVADVGWHFDRWSGDMTGTTNPIGIVMNADKSVTAVFLQNAITRMLTLAVTGNGSVNPATGQHQYNDGEQVSVTATANEGWHFDHWSGDLSGNTNPATITMSTDKSVTAVFVQNTATWTLTMAVSGSGTVTPTTGDHTFNTGETVTLSASPAAGWHFDHWMGDVTGTTNPTSIVMNSGKLVTAVFVQNAVTRTLTLAVTGNGSINPATGQHQYNDGEQVSVTATGTTGWHFDHWSGDLTGNTNPATITMNADKSVTAVFVQNAVTRTLTMAVTGDGSVIPATGQHQYNDGEQVTVTATATSGWHFDHWSGDLAGSTNPTTIAMNADKSVTAVFVQNVVTRTLTMAVTGNGSTSPAVGAHDFNDGQSVPVSAEATSGWRFDHWTGDLTGSINPTNIVMSANKTATAVFVQIPMRTLTIDTGGNGVVNRSPEDTSYPDGTVVTLTPDPALGMLFDHWEGDLTGTANPATITMNGNKNVMAVFTPSHYTLTMVVQGIGNVDPSVGARLLSAGQSVTIAATPATGWHFDHWSGDLTGNANPDSIVMNGDRTVTAWFVEDVVNYTLTIAIQGNGTMDPGVGTHTYPAGTNVLLTATPDAGWYMYNWLGDLSDNTNPASIVMNDNKTVTAEFAQALTVWNVQVMQIGEGTVYPGVGMHQYQDSSAIEFSATPASGWFFDHWEGGITGTTNPIEISDGIVANMTVTAVFIEGVPHRLTIDIIGQGTTSPPGGDNFYADGTVVTITATANPGWQFDHWDDELTGNTNPTTITMNGDHNVLAVFVSALQHTLTISGEGNGGLDPGTGANAYAEGYTVTLTATADPGWYFLQWEGDLTGSNNPATITMDADKSVKGVFALNAEQRRLTTVVKDAEGGEIDPPPGDHYYAAEEKAIRTITATPTPGYTFWFWDGFTPLPEQIYSSTVTLNIDQDQTVAARFRPSYKAGDGVLLDIHTNGIPYGSPQAVNVQPPSPYGNNVYSFGTTVTLSAVVYTGNWVFDGWLGCLTGTQTPVNLLLDGDKIVWANFIDPTTTNRLTLQVSGQGTTNPAPGTHDYAHNKYLRVTATPEAGWRFAYWDAPGSTRLSAYDLWMETDMSLTAVFLPSQSHELFMGAQTGGNVSPAAGSNLYARGSTVTLQAYPSAGYVFDRWAAAHDINGVLTRANPAKVLIDGDKTYFAVFAYNLHRLTTWQFGSGTIWQYGDGTTIAGPCEHSYTIGATIQVVVTPAAGWAVAANSPLPAGPSNVVMDADKSLGAIFVPAVNEPEMNFVDGETFTMGTNIALSDFANTHPEHDVTLHMYFIGKYETTITQYVQMLNFAQSKGYLQDINGAPYSMSTGGDVYVAGHPAINAGFRISGNQFEPYSASLDFSVNNPISNVTWFGAAAYCNWLSESQGLTPRYNTVTWARQAANGYRLPTEAEWDHAAGWNTTLPLSKGGRWQYAFTCWPNWWGPITPEVCNYGMTYGGIRPVGYFNGINPNTHNASSPWGCYDMSGNVSEWCNDYFATYPSTQQANPVGPLTGTDRVLRGGDSRTPEFSVWTCSRRGWPPNTWSSFNGFRIALGSPPVN